MRFNKRVTPGSEMYRDVLFPEQHLYWWYMVISHPSSGCEHAATISISAACSVSLNYTLSPSFYPCANILRVTTLFGTEAILAGPQNFPELFGG